MQDMGGPNAVQHFATLDAPAQNILSLDADHNETGTGFNTIRHKKKSKNYRSLKYRAGSWDNRWNVTHSKNNHHRHAFHR